MQYTVNRNNKVSYVQFTMNIKRFLGYDTSENFNQNQITFQYNTRLFLDGIIIGYQEVILLDENV